MSTLKFDVTFYLKLKVTNNGQIRPAEEIIQMILDSPPEIKQNQNKFRKAGIKKFKNWQPLVVWQASITGERADASVTQTNGRMMLDLDKVKDQDTLARMQEYFRSDTNVILCFVSPSGRGIKVLYNTDVTNPSVYPFAYKLLCGRVSEVQDFGQYIDRKTSNVSRGHFLVSDPDIYINRTATTLILQDEAKVHQYGHSLKTSAGKKFPTTYVSDTTGGNVSHCYEYPDAGSRIYTLTVLDAIYDYYKSNDIKVCDDYNEWMNHGYGIHTAICWDAPLAADYFRQFSMLASDGIYDDKQFLKTVKSIEKNNNHKMSLGTIIWYAVKKGFEMEYELGKINLSGFNERRKKVRITEFPLVKNIKIDKYLSDIQLDTETNLNLIAATGAGKNHYFATKATGNRILLVPTVDIARQMEDYSSPINPIKIVYEGVTLNGNEQVLVGTYDSIRKFNRYLDTERYSLWIDECQNVFTATALNYRNAVMLEILSSLPIYKNVVAMSGTDIPNDVLFTPEEGFSKVLIEQKNPKVKRLKLVQTNDKLTSIFSRLEHGKLNIILYNDKEKGLELAQRLNLKGFKSQLFNADTKHDDEHREVVSTREVKQGVEVLIVTDIFKEGLSFLNRDVAGIHIIGWVSHLDIEQVHSRTRVANPTIHYYIRDTKTYAYHYYNLNKALRERLDEANAAAQWLEKVAPIRYYEGNSPIAEEMDTIRYHNPRSTLNYVDKSDDNGYRVNLPLVCNSVYNEMKSTEHKNICLLLSELAAYNYEFELEQESFSLASRLQSKDGGMDDEDITAFLKQYGNCTVEELMGTETGVRVTDRLIGRLWYLKIHLYDADVLKAFRMYGTSARKFSQFEYKLKMQLFYANRERDKQTPLIVSEFFKHFKVGRQYSVKQVYRKLHQIREATNLFGNAVIESKRPTSYLRRYFNVSTYESNGKSYCRIVSKNVTGFPLDMEKIKQNKDVQHISIDDFVDFAEGSE